MIVAIEIDVLGLLMQAILPADTCLLRKEQEGYAEAFEFKINPTIKP